MVAGGTGGARSVNRLRRRPGFRRGRILTGLLARVGRPRQRRQHGQPGGEHVGAQTTVRGGAPLPFGVSTCLSVGQFAGL